MNVLVSGYHNPHYLTVTEYIERAVVGLGHGLVVFNDRDHPIPGRLRKRSKLLQTLSVGAINLMLNRIAARTRPDVILVTGGHRITRTGLRRLIRKGFRVALWTTDMPRAADLMRTTALDYHCVCSQGTEYVDIFEELGVADPRWLPMACDPQLHHPVALSDHDRLRFGSDVVFVGSHYPWRADDLEAVAGFDLSVWGPGWENLPPASPLRPYIRGAHTPPETWAKIYSASRIVLSVHIRDSGNQFQVHQASPRIFEALACGAFVLTDCQRDVLALFRDGEHLVSFSDAADLGRKVAYYLEHADERQRIAAAGRAEVLRRHTYAHRVRELLVFAAGAPPRNRQAEGRTPTRRPREINA